MEKQKIVNSLNGSDNENPKFSTTKSCIIDSETKGNYLPDIKKKLYGPFLWMGFNCLKARATSRRQFTFYHSVYFLSFNLLNF